jgi:hypothetical protein
MGVNKYMIHAAFPSVSELVPRARLVCVATQDEFYVLEHTHHLLYEQYQLRLNNRRKRRERTTLVGSNCSPY